MENTLTRKKQIITAKALTTVIGITLSVAIPQLFHVIGIVSGTGSLPGSAFLPMHLGVFFTAQILGRAIRAAAILIAFYGFKSTAVSPTIILSSIASGLPGLILQWTLLPLLIYRVKGLNKFYE